MRPAIKLVRKWWSYGPKPQKLRIWDPQAVGSGLLPRSSHARGLHQTGDHLQHSNLTYKHSNQVFKDIDIGNTSRRSGFQMRNFGSSTMGSTILRDERFAILEECDIHYFQKVVGERAVINDKDELEAANVDWLGKFKGASQVLLRPRTTKQVIVNLGAMNKILSFDEVSGVLVCEAGCILENLDKYLAEHGFTMPLDLGAKGSCQIGGNVSTNAGGLRFLRYGSLHGNVLGLEVVLPDGTIVDMLGTLRKDNTGYDLKQLFIGGEGTLGVVTKVSLLTPAKLSSVNVAFLACQDYLSCQEVLVLAKKKLGEVLSAFEFLDRSSLDMALDHLEGMRDPLPSAKQKFYLLIETTGSNENHDKEKLDVFLEDAVRTGHVVDGVVAQDNSQSSAFWRIREGIAEALNKAGAVYKYDLSIPVKDLYQLVEEMRAKLGDSAIVIGYGHLGDGNLHLNISAPKYDEKLLLQIEPFVYEWTSQHKGSVSAEHGLGFMKPHAIHYSKTPETVQLMVKMKNLLDPNGILNPYKVLPSIHI
ncbi:hypothetical protein O6H91_11G087300 [Diphasiastrum complanatum]|uniref:Uncharacterized protein n=1 Tax=Diphasiastrum complanatum TaxID=34168 RepID=A0ACC2CBE0_DIPCM|nr:hypothetical protein O6H91_11G087300 [Diphasiastrum complanatum]